MSLPGPGSFVFPIVFPVSFSEIFLHVQKKKKKVRPRISREHTSSRILVYLVTLNHRAGGSENSKPACRKRGRGKGKRRGEDGVSCDESTRVVFLADFADKIEEYSVPSFEHV